MRLILFSASIFYFLGLKLTSVIEIKPFFHSKSNLIETSVIPVEEKVASQKVSITASIKKDTLNQNHPRCSQPSGIPEKKGKNDSAK